MEVPLVSVIIPSYNRFIYLLNAINSVKSQTYKNIEIIVINDGSTQDEYLTYDFKGIYGTLLTIIHLDKNYKKTNKYSSPAANGRNIGIENSKGAYIAFLDDDDVWLPNKLEIQINEMISKNMDMCACQSFLGKGIYNSSNKYRRLNEDVYCGIIKNKFIKKDSNLLDNGFPDIFTLELQLVHNCLSTPCIVMSKDLITKTGLFNVRERNEDAEYWTKALRITSGCLYIQTPLVYIDNNHGDGRLY
jgi:glycosyltransferase involved in cell wall biosynthesis